MMSIVGYFAAILMGTVLGLLGGGGSILAVPIFVYIFEIPAHIASGYSLFVVGLIALFGAIQYERQNLVDSKTAVNFALPALCGVYISRRFIIQSLPEFIIQTSTFQLSKNSLILFTFAIVMISAALSMIRGRSLILEGRSSDKNRHVVLVSFWAFIMGLVTGFVGAGGGFLIIPMLVVLLGIDMKIAIGT
ncbi:MAG: sulfite exporter TauE/SafE family protein, partial [Bdellovibrionales bacterium]|nr:sulfite exporter TauE/SafE family protein [Bdellovibrionales bacterium]